MVQINFFNFHLSLFLQTDGKGDVIALTDEQGNIVKTYKYDPWGNIISEEGTSTLKNPFTYKGAYGYYYDEETGLYYLKARYYDPQIYRFLTKDPIEKTPELVDLQNPLSLNPYLYCEDDPVGKVDPEGEYWYYIKIGFLVISAAYSVICAVAAGYSFYVVWKRVGRLRRNVRRWRRIARRLKRQGKWDAAMRIERIANKTERELVYYITLPALAEVAREIYFGAWRTIWKLRR